MLVACLMCMLVCVYVSGGGVCVYKGMRVCVPLCVSVFNAGSGFHCSSVLHCPIFLYLILSRGCEMTVAVCGSFLGN